MRCKEMWIGGGTSAKKSANVCAYMGKEIREKGRDMCERKEGMGPAITAT